MIFLQDTLFVKLAASVVLLVALIVARILHRRSATQRGQILAVGLLLVLVLPVLTTVLPAPKADQSAGPVSVVLERNAADIELLTSTDDSMATGLIDSGQLVSPLVWLAVAAGIWLLGAITILCRLFRSHALARQLIRKAQAVQNPELLAIHRLLCLQYIPRRRVSLFLSATVTSPMTVGWLRPCIVLPDEAEQWPERTVKAVLHHEMAHVVRHDNLFRMIGDVVSVLHWFDPLVWLVISRLRYEAELACDDSVVRGGMRSSAYARVLLERSLEAPLVRPIITPAVPFACHAKRRLQALLDPQADRRHAGLRTTLGITALMLIVTLPLTQLRSTVQADPGDLAVYDRAAIVEYFAELSHPQKGPQWWREIRTELQEIRALKALKENPKLGTQMPEGFTHNVMGLWTVETHDAVFLPGAKHGCIFTSTEGYARISSIIRDKTYVFGVSATPHPPLTGFESKLDNFLSSFGMGYDGDPRAYSFDNVNNKEQLKNFRRVLTTLAMNQRFSATFSTPEE